MHSCSICRHPHKTAIEHRLEVGAPFRHVAEQFGVSVGALHRHRTVTQVARNRKTREAGLHVALTQLAEASARLNWGNPMSVMQLLRTLAWTVSLLAKAQHRL
jgi:hypothetical protein